MKIDKAELFSHACAVTAVLITAPHIFRGIENLICPSHDLLSRKFVNLYNASSDNEDDEDDYDDIYDD